MKDLILIKNGDAYALPFTVKLGDTTMTPPDVVGVELILGKMRKVYPGDIVYDSEEDKFLLELSQRESFALESGETELDARVKYSGGDVIGLKTMIAVRVAEAKSRVEI